MYYLDRIAKLDSRPNGLNSVLEVNPDALFIADMLDARRARGEALGALHGIPILLKDNINTCDGMRTSAGSLALAGHYAGRDAFIVSRLRGAGALILGKTNMTEFANAMADDMPNGYSSRGGQVKSNFASVSDPSGSSTGSAVAVSAGLCAAAVGTETCGSIISPSWNASIVGVKPTLGMISRDGFLPIAGTLDTAGPMARDVRDAALLLNALAGVDPSDAATLSRPTKINNSGDVAHVTLKGLRVGVSRAFMDKLEGDASRESCDMALALLPQIERQGVILVEADLPRAEEGEKSLGDLLGVIVNHEMKSAINRYFAAIGEATTLIDIIKYNIDHQDVALKYGQAVLERVQRRSGRLTEPEYLEALALREAMARRTDAVFTENRLDILLSVVPVAHAPLLGFPAMTLPIGQTGAGQPVGSYWMARRWDDIRLLEIGKTLEDVLSARD